VSREWFYSVRKQAAEQGLPQTLVPRSRRPSSSPNQTPAEVVALVVRVRNRLKQDGWDHGPLSVAAELRRMGIVSPSRATLARIFTRAGLVTPEPKKRPRASWTRFTYAAPNECWQMDATEWALADGTTAAIFQLTDDHSRFVIASLAARSENARDALAVVMTGIARHGIPQRLLTDNGLALNPSRRGWKGLLPEAMKALGVTPISSTPGHPQTQGKNERIHSTLKRWLRARPRASSLTQLQQQLDVFDAHYNTSRSHQSLNGATPAHAFAATPKAPEPRPSRTNPTPASVMQHTDRTVSPLGIVKVVASSFQVGAEHAGTTCHVLFDENTVMIFDPAGTLLQTHPRPPKGSYIPNGKPRGFMATQQPSALT
jgi:putative transposase